MDSADIIADVHVAGGSLKAWQFFLIAFPLTDRAFTRHIRPQCDVGLISSLQELYRSCEVQTH